MAAAIFCSRVWVSGSGNTTRIHLMYNHGSRVVMDGVSVQRALKRRRLGGQVVFLYRQARCGRLTVFVSRRMNCLCVLIPRNGFIPPRIVMMQEDETLELREKLVQRVDGWHDSNGATTNNHIPVTQRAAGV